MTQSFTLFDVLALRREFPILQQQVNGKPLAFLDSGASSQKPRRVIVCLEEYYEHTNANVHRGVYKLSEEATFAFERARGKVARFIGANSHKELIFTRNTTEAINLVARAWGDANVRAGDRILLSVMEHHSNLVPWQQLAQRTGAQLDFLPIDAQGRLVLDELDTLLTERTKLVAITHQSNVLGTINPVREIAARAHDAGALVLIDGAQSVPHMPVDVRELGIDFLAFSGHKMCGPTGIGALWGRRKILEEMPPFLGGGSMIREVTLHTTTYADIPTRFEAGTPAIGEAIGYAAAVEWLDAIGLESAHAREAEVGAYALDRLAEVPGLRVFGPPAGDDRVGIFSFALDGVHAHDVSEILDRHAVCVRAGHHCAQILMDRLGVPATARASLAVYNTRDEVDRLVEALHDVRRVFELD